MQPTEKIQATRSREEEEDSNYKKKRVYKLPKAWSFFLLIEPRGRPLIFFCVDDPPSPEPPPPPPLVWLAVKAAPGTKPSSGPYFLGLPLLFFTGSLPVVISTGMFMFKAGFPPPAELCWYCCCCGGGDDCCCCCSCCCGGGGGEGGWLCCWWWRAIVNGIDDSLLAVIKPVSDSDIFLHFPKQRKTEQKDSC